MRASLIIRTLNEARFLPQVLNALERQSIPPGDRETILVDSGSTDATVEIAAQRGFRILYISREEFSFGRSLNRGCAVAGGNVLVFVSGHCIPTNGHWLESLIAPIETGEAGITYGRQVGGEQ